MNYFTILSFFLVVASFNEGKTFGQVRECDCDNIAKRNARVPAAKKQGNYCEQKCKANNEKIGDYAEGNRKDLETNVKGNETEKFCVDAEIGQLYLPGDVWSYECENFACLRNGSIAVTKTSCPETCVLDKSKASRCCPVCKRKLTCSSREIKVELPKILLKKKDPRKLSLSELKCKPIINETHLIFKTTLPGCGTKLTKTDRGFLYTNVVQQSVYGNFVVRPWFRFSCLFMAKSIKTDASKVVNFKVVRPAHKAVIRMQYTDKKGDIATHDPMKKEIHEGLPVYVAIVASNVSRDDRYLVLETCQIMSLNRRKNFDLVINGCAVEPTFKILHAAPRRIWFSFEAKLLAQTREEHKAWFSFNGKRFYQKDREFVDLTCQAALCTNKTMSAICNRNCST